MMLRCDDPLRYLRAHPVTYRQRGKRSYTVYHWAMDHPSLPFSYCGSNENHAGWKTRLAALRAGRKIMREYFIGRAKGKCQSCGHRRRLIGPMKVACTACSAPLDMPKEFLRSGFTRENA